MLEEDHRIVVADRLDQETLGLIGVGRQHHLQPRDVGEHRVEALAVLRGGAEAGAVHGADHQRGHRLAAEHVAELGRLVEDLVEADPHEVDEHQFDDRAEPGGRGARRGADERDLGEMRVEHAVGSELRAEALGDAHRAAPGVLVARGTGAARDVLAHHDDARVALHLLAHRFVDRLAIALLRHGSALLSTTRRRRSSGPPRSAAPTTWRA